jgi:hypothetical protein
MATIKNEITINARIDPNLHDTVIERNAAGDNYGYSFYNG